jgi:hypothetical protein
MDESVKLTVLFGFRTPDAFTTLVMFPVTALVIDNVTAPLLIIVSLIVTVRAPPLKPLNEYASTFDTPLRIVIFPAAEKSWLASSANLTVSVPSQPSIVSPEVKLANVDTVTVSFPSPSVMVLLPATPTTVSAPAPVTMVFAPEPS